MASDQDPRGWLEACPELHQFASDPEVAAAVAAGDARKLHAALARRRKGKRGAFEARAIDAILARRRLFTMPVVKAPSLTTLNGIGSRLWGKSEAANDGTYVTTLFFTVLFLPIWPIAQYLVRSDGNRYSFFGELPLSARLRTWRRAVGTLAVAGAAAVGVAVWQGGSAAQVQLLNGLDYEVAIEAGGAKRKLAPGARATARVDVGRQRFRTTAPDGRVVEEMDVEVPRWTDLVVYNPVGAAALYVEPVVYVAKGEKGPNRTAAPTVYAGQAFVARDPVHYPFRQAPAEMKLESSRKQEVRWHADVVEGGWRAAVQTLVWTGRTADAATLAGRIAAAHPGSVEPWLQRIVLSNWAQGPEAALAAARDAAAAAPENADVHRQLAYFLLATGRGDEARRLFEERARREPGSALAQYLRARIEPSRVAVPMLEALAKRFPADPNVHRALGWGYLSLGRGGDAIREWDAGALLGPEGLMPLDWQVAALVRAGRVGEARERLAAALSGEGGLRLDGALLWAQLARLQPAPKHPPRHFLEKLVAGAEPWLLATIRAHAAALLGDAPPAANEIAAIEAEGSRAGVQLVAAAARTPDRALTLAASTRPDQLGTLPRGVAALLAGEAARRGDANLVARIANAAELADVPVGTILEFVRGRDVEDLDDASPEVRAALLLARARAAQAAGRDASALLRAARDADPIPGPVVAAIERWPRP
jgi:hypothetical protein